jgi:hypothetical protein
VVNTLGSVLKSCVVLYSVGGAAGEVEEVGEVGEAGGVVAVYGVVGDAGEEGVLEGDAIAVPPSAASTSDSRPLVVLEFVEVGVVTIAGAAGALAKSDEAFNVDSEAGGVDELVSSAREFDTVATRF